MKNLTGIEKKPLCIYLLYMHIYIVYILKECGKIHSNNKRYNKTENNIIRTWKI